MILKTPPMSMSPEESPFEFVIVGSGGGGAPLAARLAEYGHRVLVRPVSQERVIVHGLGEFERQLRLELVRQNFEQLLLCGGGDFDRADERPLPFEVHGDRFARRDV